MMKHKGDWLLLLAAFIGGGGFISLKYLLDWGYDPFQVIFGRFLTASVCMCLVYCKRLKRITKEEWRVGSILGALLAAMFLLMTVGLQYTTLCRLSAGVCSGRSRIGTAFWRRG